MPGGRRWLRRFVVAVVAAVSLSLVATAGPAQAFVPPPPVPPIVYGAVRAVAPVAAPAAAVCAASVVCAVGVGAVVAGTALYATRDTWIPWVQGLLPGSGDSSRNGPGISPVIMHPITIGADGSSWSVKVQNTNSRANDLDYFQYRVQTVCRIGAGYGYNQVIQARRAVASLGSWTTSGTCGAGGTIVGVQTAPNPSQGASDGPTNFSAWGSVDVKDAEPAVEYRVTMQCRTPAGATQAVEVIYKGVSGGFAAPSCEANGMEAGSVGTGLTVEGKYPGDTAFRPVWDYSPSYGSKYTECDPAFGNGPCSLSIEYKGVPCQVGSSACVEWTQRVLEGNTDYECHWGPYRLPLVNCDVLERTYRPEGARLTGPNTDGLPDTWTDPNGQPGSGGQPGTGGTPGPVDTPVTDPHPDPSNESCYPTGVAAFNPVEWVLRPVKCALVWAFVPSTEAVESITNGAKGDMLGSSVGEWWDAFGSWGDAFAGTGLGQMGCRGPGVPTGFLGEKGVLAATIYPFDACSGPKATAAATSHMVLSITIVFLSGWRLVRIVGRPFGYDLDLMNGGGTSRT